MGGSARSRRPVRCDTSAGVRLRGRGVTPGGGASRRGEAAHDQRGIVVVGIEVATNSDLLAVVILTDFSAFNPGGDPVGASVDDIAREFARFESSQSGEGIGDSHGCHTGIVDGSHFPTSLPRASCGVSSPDSSQGEFVFAVPEGSVAEFTYRLSVAVEASAVPEPAALAILSAGLIALSFARRRT